MTQGGVPVAVLGAGPAGTGLAFKLAARGFEVTVIERSNAFGGNAGSFEVEGQQVDYGSHRLHPSCAPEILADIERLLKGGLLRRPRHGRIRLRGRWLHFPLRPGDLALHAHPAFAAGVARDAVWKSRRAPAEENFATVLERGLGPTICRDFYFPYARKIWGVEPEELDAEQARRRVSAGSLQSLARKVLARGGGRHFFYPAGGFGRISEAYAAAAAEAGACFLMNTRVDAVEVEGGKVRGVRLRGEAGPARIEAARLFSTIPVPALARLAVPAAPAEVLESAGALRYRAMTLVYVALETDRFSEYDAHYFPEAGIPVTRISEPKNYSLAGAPGRTVLCAEMPCGRDDEVWRSGERVLGQAVLAALESAGLPVRARVRRMEVRRLAQAYPIYGRDYRRHFERLDRWAGAIEGLVTLGRQGLFAHDNTHHTLAMAYGASDCLDAGGSFDLERWAGARASFERFVVED